MSCCLLHPLAGDRRCDFGEASREIQVLKSRFIYICFELKKQKLLMLYRVTKSMLRNILFECRFLCPLQFNSRLSITNIYYINKNLHVFKISCYYTMCSGYLSREFESYFELFCWRKRPKFNIYHYENN